MPHHARSSGRTLWRSLPLMLLVASLWWPGASAAALPRFDTLWVQTDSYPVITIQVSIVNENGQAVAGLTPDQVAILEESRELKPTQVAMLRDSEKPLGLLFAVDTSPGMADPARQSALREAIRTVTGRLRPTDSAGLVRIGPSVKLDQPFTRDQAAVNQSVERLTTESGRRLYDGTYLATAEAARFAGNRAVILITSGEDINSQVAFGTASNQAFDLGMQLYVIGVGTQVRDDVLENLAIGSRGRYYKAVRPTDLVPVLRAAYEDFSSRYEVIYTTGRSTTQAEARVVSQLAVTTAEGRQTTNIPYSTPRLVTPPGETTTSASRPSTVPAMPPSRPRGDPVDDNVIVLLGTLTGLGVMTTMLGFALYRDRLARRRRLGFFTSTLAAARRERVPTLFHLMLVFFVRAVATILIRLLPPHQVRQISHRLILAGSPNDWRASHFVTLKGCLAAVGLLLGWLIPPPSLLAAILLPILVAIIGFILPEVWLNSRVRTRQQQVLRALPSALDLLAISVEAGLGLDGAMLEVVHKWRNSLSEEFATILADLKVGKSRREAMRGFVHRTELPEVAAFVSALIQADEVGLSIGRTLQVQAEQMRLRQRQRAERLAREAGVKMLLPMAVLIFPAIFVVILVPALPTILDSLRSIAGG